MARLTIGIRLVQNIWIAQGHVIDHSARASSATPSRCHQCIAATKIRFRRKRKVESKLGPGKVEGKSRKRKLFAMEGCYLSPRMNEADVIGS